MPTDLINSSYGRSSRYCDEELGEILYFPKTKQRARKAHTCNYCGSDILPGVTYWRQVSLYEGSITTEKCCTPSAQCAAGEVH